MPMNTGNMWKLASQISQHLPPRRRSSSFAGVDSYHSYLLDSFRYIGKTTPNKKAQQDTCYPTQVTIRVRQKNHLDHQLSDQPRVQEAYVGAPGSWKEATYPPKMHRKYSHGPGRFRIICTTPCCRP